MNTEIERIRHEMMVHTDVRKSDYSAFDYCCTATATKYNEFGERDETIFLRYYVKGNEVLSPDGFHVLVTSFSCDNYVDVIDMRFLPSIGDKNPLDYMHSIENMLIEKIIEREAALESALKKAMEDEGPYEFNEED